MTYISSEDFDRLAKGCCMRHGIPLVPDHGTHLRAVYRCQRKGCDFTADAKAGSVLARAISTGHLLSTALRQVLNERDSTVPKRKRREYLAILRGRIWALEERIAGEGGEESVKRPCREELNALRWVLGEDANS